MKGICVFLSFSLVLREAADAFASPQEKASSPAQDKFKQDIKAAVLNGSITIPQLKELQTNAEVLKTLQVGAETRCTGDFLTPYHAVFEDEGHHGHGQAAGTVTRWNRISR